MRGIATDPGTRQRYRELRAHGFTRTEAAANVGISYQTATRIDRATKTECVTCRRPL